MGSQERWGNTLKRSGEAILDHFDNRTTAGFAEGCDTRTKMPKPICCGLRNLEAHWSKKLLRVAPPRRCFHAISDRARVADLRFSHRLVARSPGNTAALI
jgi:Transposase and inactivated derivatives